MMTTPPSHQEQVKTARLAGVWYLLMAISGILGFMVFHPQVFVSTDPQQTLTNLMEHTTLARTRLLMELLIVVSQALTALWFYKLFRNEKGWMALAVGIWGTVNAVIIMVSAVAMGAALDIAHATQAVESQGMFIDLLTRIITHAWGVGGLFFGLWLIPLGILIVQSQRMPLWLGRTLILGGIGYLVSTVLTYAGVEGDWVGLLNLPATVGEFWMIGYLLIFGIRPKAA